MRLASNQIFVWIHHKDMSSTWYICTSIARVNVPESNTAINVTSCNDCRIDTHVDIIGRRIVTESGRLPIGLSRNVPDFKRSISRPSNDALAIMKEPNTCYFVRMTCQLMNLWFFSTIASTQYFKFRIMRICSPFVASVSSKRGMSYQYHPQPLPHC